LDAGVDKFSKGGGDVATVGLGGEQLGVMHNVDRPHIASRSGASTPTISPNAPTKMQ
jgi:hypothetical protein